MYKTIFFIIIIIGQQLFPQDDFTIIGLPDTQYYSEDIDTSGAGKGTGSIATFIAQTQWIVDNWVDSNIVYVAHLGDCVENGDNGDYFLPDQEPTNVQEWEKASSAMYLLEDEQTTGLTDGIPYGVAVGNHDQSPFGDFNGTTTLFNQYFGYDHFNGRNYYGGHYGGDNNNHYDLFSVNETDFIVIYIDYNEGQKAGDPEIIWAQDLLQTYLDRRAIIVSHFIINAGIQATFGDQGQVLYDAFKSYSNVFLMLCGHRFNEGRRTEVFNGDTVHILMSNYQALSEGGHGLLRIMKFSPSAGTISVLTYSPTTDNYRTQESSQFTLNYYIPTLPVELSFFTGSHKGNNIELRWRTETELNNYGFIIERSNQNSDWLVRGFVRGNGSSSLPNDYTFTDLEINDSGNYKYRLKQLDYDGSFEYSKVVSVTVDVPALFSLSQNYPNPFNPETRIDYTIPEQQNVSLKVYNMLGEVVKELVNEVKPAGTYKIKFDGAHLPSGVYVYRIETESFNENKKMTLLK